MRIKQREERFPEKWLRLRSSPEIFGGGEGQDYAPLGMDLLRAEKNTGYTW